MRLLMVKEAEPTPLKLPLIYAEVDSADLAATGIDYTPRQRPERMNLKADVKPFDGCACRSLPFLLARSGVSSGIVGGLSVLGHSCGITLMLASN